MTGAAPDLDVVGFFLEILFSSLYLYLAGLACVLVRVVSCKVGGGGRPSSASGFGAQVSCLSGLQEGRKDR